MPGSPNEPGFRTTNARGKAWIVDDSPLEGELMRRGLMGAHDAEVFSGAAPMIERFSRGERPDVLVLDWSMPEISGMETCRFVRESTDEASLPIIIVTVSTNPEVLTTGLAAGANDLLRKPFDVVELVARVNSLVRTKRLHEQLVVAEADLRREASFREKFLAILAHDLRQPLNVFGIAGELLGSPDADEKMRAKLSRQVIGASARMQRMIEELLDFSRARPAGGLPLTKTTLDAGHVVNDVIEEIRIAHPERTVKADVKGPCKGDWDRDRLAQVVSNLVENALSHSAPESAVDVTLACAGANVELTVENDGTIRHAELGTLFDAFRRGASRTTRPSGLGLGLYIVSEVAKGHGGTVGVTSERGRTRFTVSLPATADSVP